MLQKWLKRAVRFYLPVYQIESDKIKVLYAGYSEAKKKYYARLIAKDNNGIKKLGRKWFWRIPALTRNSDYDLIFAEVSPLTFNFYQSCHGYVLPEWTRMIINIERPLSEIMKRKVSDFSDVYRKIRKNNLTYELLRDNDSFNSFVNLYYLPYLTKRHGDEAWIEDLSPLWHANPAPYLIAVRYEGTIAGMALVKKEGDSFTFLRVGLLDGNDDYRRHGVIGALYYFAVLEGQKQECRYIDVGGTRPFLTDGLTRFKLGLSADFVPEMNPGNEVFLWLGVNERSAAANEFLQSNPFVHVGKDLKIIKPSLG